MGHMGLFFYNKIGSIISIVDLPTTNIIEPISPCRTQVQPAANFLVCTLIFIEYESGIEHC
ncbi:hypothetical protein [Streptococcus pneumoniae]|uniref:hypothetical protein n=1 Tax=Streptococcus pneumoniae TaxID=1313 RepID=UPI001E5969D0|nr:hypothetical protein [Streptococcus pneumoniae]